MRQIQGWTVSDVHTACNDAAITAAAAALLVTYQAAPPFHSSKHERHASPGHKESFARVFTGHTLGGALQESYSTTIPLKSLRKDISDEEVLARFNRGFFSGPAFTLERWLLCGPRLSLLSTSEIEKALNASVRPPSTGFVVGKSSWGRDLSLLSPTSTPPVSSLFFGNFIVLDSSSLSPERRREVLPKSPQYTPPPYPFIEWAFRGDGVAVASSHRFEVTRHRVQSPAGGLEEVVKITFSHVSCSPRTGNEIWGGWVTAFHQIYSKYLFSDGIRGVLEE